LPTARRGAGSGRSNKSFARGSGFAGFFSALGMDAEPESETPGESTRPDYGTTAAGY
jgi:hypothetical protein